MSANLWRFVGYGPLREDEIQPLEELEQLLEETPEPLELQETEWGILLWNPTVVNPEITLLASPYGQAYRGSVTPEDLEDEPLEDLLQRRGGEHGF